MNLLIKGMDMPKNCMKCFCLEAFDDEIYGRQHFCGLLGIDALAKEHSRHNNCPLVEIPTPHGRLIDADELMDLLEKSVPEKNRGHQFYVFRHMLRNAPTIIEAEE